MSGRVVRWPQAKRDLIEHYACIAADKIDPAGRFLRAAEQTFADLATMPGLGHVWPARDPRLAGVRIFGIPGFRNYLVFYRAIEGGVEILAVLHGARDLGAAMRGREEPEHGEEAGEEAV